MCYVHQYFLSVLSVEGSRRLEMFHKGNAVSALIGLKFPKFSLQSQNNVLAVNSCFG